MKVVILTSKPYWKFVTETIGNCAGNHDFWISEATTFPNDYDVGISFMHLNRVPASQVNTHTWINFHPGPLPQYKGRNLCYHAIMNGEKEFGATVHYMDENFDTGDIIDMFIFSIEPNWTAEDLHNKTIDMSKRIFREFLSSVLAGEKFARFSNVGGTYYEKKPIDDFIGITEYQERKIRAITYGEFYPKIDIGGVIYKIVRDE